MTTPQIPGMQQQIVTPPIHKTHVTCCGYTSSQGTPHLWTCPGCGKRYNEDAPALNAEPPPAS